MSVDGYVHKDFRRFLRAYRWGNYKGNFCHSDIVLMLDTIESNCRWPDFCIEYELATDSLDHTVVRFHFSTGGWSGHEEMIEELKRTWFWTMFWESSRRGGHYVFEIPAEKKEGRS